MKKKQRYNSPNFHSCFWVKCLIVRISHRILQIIKNSVTTIKNETPARTLLEFIKYSPGKYFGKINTPIYAAACTKNDLVPADKTIELAKKAKNSVCKTYNCGHFEIYCNELFEEAVTDYIEFYNKIFA